MCIQVMNSSRFWWKNKIAYSHNNYTTVYTTKFVSVGIITLATPQISVKGKMPKDLLNHLLGIPSEKEVLIGL